MATAEHSRAYRKRQASRDVTLIETIQQLTREVTSLKELIHSVHAVNVTKVTSPSLDSPIKNLPSEDEESRKRKEAGKILESCLPDSSLPASPRAEEPGFFGNAAEAAERLARKRLTNGRL